MRRAVLASLVLAFCCSCASAPRPDPTPEQPVFGCILPTLRERGSSDKWTRLPETVRVIGRTPIDDGARWKVLRGPNFNPDEWEPHLDGATFPNDPNAIWFGARCGKEPKALQQIFDASRGDVDAAERSRPPDVPR